MNEFKILMVEDDPSIRNLIRTSLKIEHYTCLSAATGNEAVSMCAMHKPDLVLLDLGLPDMDGVEVLKTIRLWSAVPVIVISARSDDNDKIEALDNGADDYLTKPFSVQDMLARIRAVQRRIQYSASVSGDSSVFENGKLKIDYAASAVTLDDEPVHLTPIEYRILCLLARNAGRVLTHTYIISQIWGKGIETDIISLRVYMTTLRKKLRCGEEEPLIQTHVGIGYQMIRR